MKLPETRPWRKSAHLPLFLRCHKLHLMNFEMTGLFKSNPGFTNRSGESRSTLIWFPPARRKIFNLRVLRCHQSFRGLFGDGLNSPMKQIEFLGRPQRSGESFVSQRFKASPDRVMHFEEVMLSPLQTRAIRDKLRR
ncbi:hypothetical protein AVEN_153698-1 [Araneus ventricosus]|uniref:Uncharacterized protein n=1 Tax=Araneus ventricosus TaxID=182803 RepID=A0A4Y2G2J5_ARAVE|nr:hypothetical protein AVEN_153698-1 [Araneus ventricosus]